MLSLLFDLTIAPIQLWMASALEYAYKLTASYGWSIVLMSLVVNFIILPIYIQAERWQQNERKIKNSISEREKMIKRAFKGQERFAMISTLYRQAGYSPLLALRSSLGFFLQIPFFCAAYLYLSDLKELQGVSYLFIKNLGAPDHLISVGNYSINFLPILMTVINLLSAFIYSEGLAKKDKIQLVGMALLFLVLLYDSPSGLVLYWTCNNIFSLIKNLIYKLSSRLIKESSEINPNTKYTKTYWVTSIFVGFMVVFYFPLKLIFSDISIFPDWRDDVVNLISYFELWLLFSLAIYLLVKSKAKLLYLSVFSLLFVVLLVIVFGFLFVPKFGVIDNFVIQDLTPFNDHYNKIKDISILVSLLLLTFVLLRYNKKGVILAVCGTSIVFCLADLVWDSFRLRHVIKNNEQKVQIVDKLPDPQSNFLSFSKEKNVVVIMLDQFTGIHFQELLNRFPGLYEELNGFIYYSDTLSSGICTILGKAPILGGKSITPEFLSIDNGESLEVRINREIGRLAKDLLKNGWRVSIQDDIWTNPSLFQLKGSDNVNTLNSNIFWQGFGQIWEKRHHDNLNKKEYSPLFFLSFSLFRASPFSLKDNIYRNGTWLKQVGEWSLSNLSSRQLAQIDYLSEYSTLDSEKPTFRFLTNELTHMAWSLNSKCEPAQPSQNQAFNSAGQQLQNEYCAIRSLIKWFSWMKQEKIYDNSLLILVSDHGRQFPGPNVVGKGTAFEDFKNNAKGYPYFLGENALLLVKPFDSRGKLKVDDQPMMNYDVQNIILSSLGYSQKEAELSNKGRIRKVYTGKNPNFWIRQGHEKNRFSGIEGYEIKGKIGNSWNKIEDERKK